MVECSLAVGALCGAVCTALVDWSWRALLSRSGEDGGARAVSANNEQIDNTDYYRLPCGLYLEDFIVYLGLDFAHGSALKYAWRAGRKHGESRDKDMKKMMHYCRLIARTRGDADATRAYERICELVWLAARWDGKQMPGMNIVTEKEMQR